jgi:serine/threonine-protein kinase
MYELLTGVMPFEGEGVGETLAAILDATPAPPRTHTPALPRALEKVVLRCLKKAREDRYASVAELAKALAPFGSGRWAELPAKIQATLASGAYVAGPDSLEGLSTGADPQVHVDPLAETIPPPSLVPSGSLALVRTNVSLPRPSASPRRAARSFVGGALAGAAIGVLTGIAGWYGSTPYRAPRVAAVAIAPQAAVAVEAEPTPPAATATPTPTSSTTPPPPPRSHSAPPKRAVPVKSAHGRPH